MKKTVNIIDIFKTLNFKPETLNPKLVILSLSKDYTLNFFQ